MILRSPTEDENTDFDRVGNGSRRPRPPNRACGSPAHGSPVGEPIPMRQPPTQRCKGEQPMCREKALAMCLLDAVASAANMRSGLTEAFVHNHSRLWTSAPCLTLTG